MFWADPFQSGPEPSNLEYSNIFPLSVFAKYLSNSNLRMIVQNLVFISPRKIFSKWHFSDSWFKNVFRCKIRRNFPVHGYILFANAEIVYKLRPDPPLHFDKWQICTEKRNASGRRLLPATMLKCWPHKVTFTSLPTYWFVSTTTKSTMCLGYWIQLKIRVRSSNALHYLKVAEATI